ncbi:hypothetical protein C8R32_11816 [Nitrosospira sp. Nsp5]|uniref:Entry exclusion lipoprotein TrbK n=1 Tax=Nitrosospira multiformis TaxID=1231 RepID=A0ABY0TMT3_9PROT|nr:hypothetical protein C8R32_11816 [Nitrosospira sp. Nsp5]SDR11001.1 hypothetical protein SAMN05216402_3272 [Nitrosospira multiformis]
MKLQYSAGTWILVAVILSSCTENIPCSEIWRYRGMPEYEGMAKKCPKEAASAEEATRGTFKKSEPKEW